MAVEVRPLNEKEIDERLGEFERRFELPSEVFFLAFRNGQLHETEEFEEWSLLIAARNLLLKAG